MKDFPREKRLNNWRNTLASLIAMGGGVSSCSSFSINPVQVRGIAPPKDMFEIELKERPILEASDDEGDDDDATRDIWRGANGAFTEMGEYWCGCFDALVSGGAMCDGGVWTKFRR